MADRCDFFFRQRVQESELDLAFELLEKADRNLAADLGIYGIIAGAVPSQHAPVPDLTIDLTAPARAYDHLGQRIFFGTGQVADCSVDLLGIPTEVGPGKERWLGVFLKFDRLLSDPRTDGNSQQVFFRRDESFQVVVRQGPEGPPGGAPKVALQDDELLICDVRRTFGQTQIFNADIDTSRRQAFIFATGNAVAIAAGLWAVLQPAVATVQAALDEVDAELADHFGGTARRHPATHIDYPPHGFVAANTVKGALDEVVDDLSSAVAGNPGAQRIGADAVAGVPHALPAGNVDGQLSQILAWLNAHEGAVAGAHNASAIAAAVHAYISGTSVQAQLQEIVSDLQSQSAGLGASQVGNNALAGAPYSAVAGTVRDHLVAILAALNAHTGSGDHDARYYNVGETVGNADTVDGQHASAFATVSHNHDDRYLRRVFSTQVLMDAGTTQDITTQPEQPDIVTVSYNYPDPGTGLPQATTYGRGALTNDIRFWITKLDMGGGNKDYRVTVNNGSSYQLWINVAVHRRD